MDSPIEHPLTLLQELDDSVRWEFPPGYDYDAAEQRFLAFARDLEQACGIPLKPETGATVQDASFLGQIFLHGWMVQAPITLPDTALLRVSNWGNLATVSDEALIHPEALARIKATLRQHGYDYIPPSVLKLPYTGKNGGVTGIATWWIRYFDWV